MQRPEQGKKKHLFVSFSFLFFLFLEGSRLAVLARSNERQPIDTRAVRKPLKQKRLSIYSSPSTIYSKLSTLNSTISQLSINYQLNELSAPRLYRHIVTDSRVFSGSKMFRLRLRGYWAREILEVRI